MPIGWVLERAKEIVGWFANVPLHYVLNGELVRTMTPRSWVVDEDVRTFAVLLADTFLRQQNVDLFLSTSGNKHGSAGLAAVGARQIPQQIAPECAFWVTGYRGFAASYLQLKNILRANALAHAAGAAVWLLDTFRPSLPHINTVRRNREFGEEFDNFWCELRRVREHILLGRRDRAALDWHFGGALRSGRGWLFTYHDKGRMTAYSLFLRSDHSVVGLRRMILADFQQIEEDENALAAMLRAAADESRQQGIHCVQILSSRLEASAVVQRLSPHKRVKPSASMSYLYAASGALGSQLNHQNYWDISIFDGDSSLYPAETEGSIIAPNVLQCPATQAAQSSARNAGQNWGSLLPSGGVDE
jgi:hypothetical protein